MPQHSIEEQLLRYRIEKKLAGRRDLLLHLFVYISVAILFRLSVPWFQSPLDYLYFGGLWSVPLILHGLRYYYRCGPGNSRRADEIERAIDEQQERTGLDEDEALLIEERVSKRVSARRVLAAHGLASVAILAVYLPFLLLEPVRGPWTAAHIQQTLALFGLIFALHMLRFFLVHGRTPQGRALKIEAEVERAWHRSRERGRERRDAYEAADATAARELDDGRGWRMRLSDEGEFEQMDERLAGSAQAGTGRL